MTWRRPSCVAAAAAIAPRPPRTSSVCSNALDAARTGPRCRRRAGCRRRRSTSVAGAVGRSIGRSRAPNRSRARRRRRVDRAAARRQPHRAPQRAACRPTAERPAVAHEAAQRARDVRGRASACRRRGSRRGGRRASGPCRARARRRSSGRSGGPRGRAGRAAAPRCAGAARGRPLLTNGRPMRTGSPAAERVGAPVAVVVDGVEALPRRRGQHDEHVARSAADCTTTGAATLRPRVRASKRYRPDLPPGAAKRTSRERVPRPRSRIWRSPTRRSVQLKSPSPGDVTATAARSPAPTGSERRLRAEVAHGDRRRGRAAVCRTPRRGGTGADEPTLPACVARAHDDDVGAGGDAAAVRAVPSHVPAPGVVGELDRLVEDRPRAG